MAGLLLLGEISYNSGMGSKKFLPLLLSFLIGTALFLWIGKFVGWQEIKKSLSLLRGWQGMVIFGFTLLAALAGSWRWKEILKGEGVRIPFIELIKPYLAGFAMMFLAPVVFLAGEIFRGYFLKEKKSVPWSKSMASVMIDRISEWTVNLIIIFFGAGLFLYTMGMPPRNLVIIFGGVLFVFASGISYFYFRTIRRESMARFFLKIFGLGGIKRANSILDIEEEIFDFFKLEKIAMWKTFLLSFLKALAMYARTLFLIISLGKNIPALSALSIFSFTYLAAMVPIPAALGSHEAIQVFAFNSLGLGASTATAFTMIVRAADLLMALTGAVILFRLGVGLFKKHLK